MDFRMNALSPRLAGAAALLALLAACDPAAMTGLATMTATPSVTAPALAEGVYGARNDMNFAVPAVPVEQVPVEFRRQTVAYETNEAIGTIIINPAAKHLYLVTGKNTALRYGIAVGRAGFQWSGEAIVAEHKYWPTWTPPEEMIARKPELAQWEKGQPGGPTNPLGARALYLTSNGVDYGYRIHGTPEWYSIGQNASSGCIRMINQDVMDLFDRVPDGTKVIVLNADGSMPTGLTLPPPAPKPKVAAPVAPVEIEMPPLPEPPPLDPDLGGASVPV
jgi:lipoprotein-anchoring transpeptidase ErfK/SrfK